MASRHSLARRLAPLVQTSLASFGSPWSLHDRVVIWLRLTHALLVYRGTRTRADSPPRSEFHDAHEVETNAFQYSGESGLRLDLCAARHVSSKAISARSLRDARLAAVCEIMLRDRSSNCERGRTTRRTQSECRESAMLRRGLDAGRSFKSCAAEGVRGVQQKVAALAPTRRASPSPELADSRHSISRDAIRANRGGGGGVSLPGC